MKHFVYMTTNLINDRYYIGKHSTKNLYDGYLGSGKIVTQAVSKYGKENFKIEILKMFDTSEEAYEYERKILAEGHLNNLKCYNLKEGGSGFGPGSVVAKNLKGEIKRVPKNEFENNPELTSIHKGFVTVILENGSTSKVTAEEFNSGNWNGVTKGLVPVRDKNGKVFQISVNDPRLKSEDFKYCGKGGHNEDKVNITDGEKNKYIHRGDPIPAGWKLGDFKITNSGKIRITNGQQDAFIFPEEIIPEGWWKGAKCKGITQEDRKAKLKAITNGKINKYISPDSEVPKGWREGKKGAA